MPSWLLIAGITLFSAAAQAGVALGATRVIFPADQKQVPLAVISNKDNGTWLIQSWVENSAGKKDPRFIVTPPLFAMAGKKENTLRIVNATDNRLPQDRESLFWLNVKAIPAMDKGKLNSNTLQLAIISRIKLLYRPEKLTPAPEQAAQKLAFRRRGSRLMLINPTPYYLTVTELKAGSRALDHALVPPLGETSVSLPADAGNTITWQTINDYGALTPQIGRAHV